MRAAPSLTLVVLIASLTVTGLAMGKGPPVPKQSVFIVGCTLKEDILFLAKSEYTCCCPADTTEGWGRKPRIMLTFANKATRSLWLAVTLTPPSSQEACEHRGAIDAKGKAAMFFTQDSKAKGDYVIRILACADSAFADSVESTGWKLRPR